MFILDAEKIEDIIYKGVKKFTFLTAYDVKNLSLYAKKSHNSCENSYYGFV
ncbi:hypothetical protein X874_1320 [Mannheimia varigena USDA-ARS-USMARC-1312]|nr:hypothetical protein X874_1320 [Mannheimia varigena USDA-ARS-USMARC-1312]